MRITIKVRNPIIITDTASTDISSNPNFQQFLRDILTDLCNLSLSFYREFDLDEINNSAIQSENEWDDDNFINETVE